MEERGSDLLGPVVRLEVAAGRGERAEIPVLVDRVVRERDPTVAEVAELELVLARDVAQDDDEVVPVRAEAPARRMFGGAREPTHASARRYLTTYDGAVTDIELVTSYYAAFNRGEWDAMCDHLTEDVAHDLNQGGRELGRATFRAFLDRMNRSYREQLRDIVVMAGPAGHAGAEYIVEGTYLATDAGLPPATGQRYTLPGGAFFTIRDGKIARVTNYYNLQDWLKQVGAA